MTTRGQNLRSSTTGATPAAGTRLPGELFVNFPDLQLGTIDASKNPQKLVAVRFFSATANYAVGDYVVQAGQLYRAKVAITAGAFNSAQWATTGGSVLVSGTKPATPTPGDLWWDSVGGQLYVFYDDGNTQQWVVAVNQNMAAGVYLPLTGGTLTGPLTGTAVTAKFLAMNDAAGTYRTLNWQTSGSSRWKIYADSSAESGSNAGSNLVFEADSDTGALLSAPLSITRATGVVNINGTGASPTAGVPVVGGANLYLNKTGTAAANLAGTTNGSLRWTLALGNGLTESGSNNGSDFNISRCSDAGGYIDTPFTITRATGAATLTGPLAGTSATFSGGVTATGATLTGPLAGTSATFSGNVISTGAVQGGSLTTLGGVSGAIIVSKQVGSGDAWISHQNSAGTQQGYSGWNHTDGNIYHAAQAAQLGLIGTTFQSSFTYQTCPGGGPWGASSDARIKAVEGDYAGGLDAILGLRPVVYRYLGNDTTTADVSARIGPDQSGAKVTSAPYPSSPHYAAAKDAKTFVGLIAQEVEAVMPGMVRKRAGFIDGEAVEDFRDLDTTELVYALVNAVKQLSAEVNALKAGAR